MRVTGCRHHSGAWTFGPHAPVPVGAIAACPGETILGELHIADPRLGECCPPTGDTRCTNLSDLIAKPARALLAIPGSVDTLASVTAALLNTAQLRDRQYSPVLESGAGTLPQSRVQTNPTLERQPHYAKRSIRV